MIFWYMGAKDKIIAWRLYGVSNMKTSCHGDFDFKVIFYKSKVCFLHKGVFCPFLYYIVLVDKPAGLEYLSDEIYEIYEGKITNHFMVGDKSKVSEEIVNEA